MSTLYLTSKRLDGLLPLLPKDPEQTRVAFIPTAAAPYEDKWFMENDLQTYKALGYQIHELDLKEKNIDQLREATKGIDVVFVSGGSALYLLEHVQKSGFDQLVPELLDQGTIYAGASAGAMLVAPTLEPAKGFDEGLQLDLQSYDGLGLVDYLLMPHFDSPKYADAWQQVQKEHEGMVEFRPLRDDQAMLIQDGQEQLLTF